MVLSLIHIYPAAPVYAVGDTVYIEDDAYQITELREDTVQLPVSYTHLTTITCLWRKQSAFIRRFRQNE